MGGGQPRGGGNGGSPGNNHPQGTSRIDSRGRGQEIPTMSPQLGRRGTLITGMEAPERPLAPGRFSVNKHTTTNTYAQPLHC